MGDDRRAFLKAALAAAAAGGMESTIGRALALPARRVSGTIADVDHVVVLMQENRSFDHYFGALGGVRGFDDPRALVLPGGRPVWQQPITRGAEQTIPPFRLNEGGRNHNAMASLDHGWRGPHETWRRYDAWVERKTALTMGYHDRRDLPFHYALADAFTICDAYHCSVFGSTNPNRMFLFTGTSGLSVGAAGRQVGSNVDDGNWTGDAARDDLTFASYRWTTYAERLQRAGIDWRVYQEHDNYGDNALAYFAAFRGLDPADELYRRGRAIVPGSTAQNAAASEGEHIVAALRRDVERGTLPQVSWIVAPFKMCEHPEARGMEYGQYFVARVLAALTADPAVWAKTALFVTYDENDGFFDHVPPPIPPIHAGLGKSTIAVQGEAFGDEPLGLGPRVPMLVVSPWSKGGWVNSQVFDHSSVIRFMERRFGVMEPNITPWRRAVTGDLTSAFDFDAADRVPPPLPDPGDVRSVVRAGQQARRPTPPALAQIARQEPGARPVRALPYRFDTNLRVDPERAMLHLRVDNRGAAGVALALYPDDADGGPRYYTVGAGHVLEDGIPILPDGARLFRLYGPDGFLREAATDALATARVDLRGSFDPARRRFVIEAINRHDERRDLVFTSGYAEALRRMTLPPGRRETIAWDLAPRGLWYDITVRSADGDRALMQFAGRGQDGRPGHSDPALQDQRRS